jgi:aspartate/methionine/tyrosine aminotransferase
VFPRIDGVDDVSAFAERLLRERETEIVPGRFFDAPAHFRLGFGGDTEQLRGGLERLGAALDEP